MAGVAADKKRYFVVGAGVSSLTNEHCSPYTVHYVYDTVAMARGTASAVLKAGGKSWYFVTADYASGAALQNDASKIIQTGGRTVAGAVKHPLGASDFSSFMQQARTPRRKCWRAPTRAVTRSTRSSRRRSSASTRA